MEWSETVRKAAILAQEKGYITWYELDQYSREPFKVPSRLRAS